MESGDPGRVDQPASRLAVCGSRRLGTRAAAAAGPFRAARCARRFVRRALAEGIARRTLDIAHREPLPAERLSWDDLPWDGSPTESQRETASRWHALTIRVHADWLMTPREDLGGQPPRHFLHRGRDWVDHELHNRQRQWSNEGRCPRPLDRDTFAYRSRTAGPSRSRDVLRSLPRSDRRRLGSDRRGARDRRRRFDEGAPRTLRSGGWRKVRSTAIPRRRPAIIEHERRRMPLVGDRRPPRLRLPDLPHGSRRGVRVRADVPRLRRASSRTGRRVRVFVVCDARGVGKGAGRLPPVQRGDGGQTPGT